MHAQPVAQSIDSFHSLSNSKLAAHERVELAGLLKYGTPVCIRVQCALAYFSSLAVHYCRRRKAARRRKYFLMKDRLTKAECRTNAARKVALRASIFTEVACPEFAAPRTSQLYEYRHMTVPSC